MSEPRQMTVADCECDRCSSLPSDARCIAFKWFGYERATGRALGPYATEGEATLAVLNRLAGEISRILARRPDLLQRPYRAQVEAGAHPLTGHCYVACEALYHAGAQEAGYRPHVMRVATGTHWFLKNASGAILDPTRAQFATPPDYSSARGCGFLTRGPSKRARKVLALLSEKTP